MVLVVVGCGSSSSGGPGQEVTGYPGGEVMPIGGPPLSDAEPIPLTPPQPCLTFKGLGSQGCALDASADYGVWMPPPPLTCLYEVGDVCLEPVVPADASYDATDAGDGAAADAITEGATDSAMDGGGYTTDGGSE